MLNVRLDEQSFGSARQRMAAILTRYGDAIFDTRHPVAQRGDLAAMIGTSRVMMYRTLRGLEADGLVKRHHGGGISIVDRERLARAGRRGAAQTRLRRSEDRERSTSAHNGGANPQPGASPTTADDLEAAPCAPSTTCYRLVGRSGGRPSTTSATSGSWVATQPES